MKRTDLFLTILADNPQGLTGNELWHLAFKTRTYEHNVSPMETWPTLNNLRRNGKVVKTADKRNGEIIWRIA